MAKIQKIYKLGKFEKKMKKEYFEKKLSSFKKVCLPKLEGVKYAGGNRPS